MLLVPRGQHEPLMSVTFRGSRSSFPSPGAYFLEGQPTGKGQGRGELEVGIHCIPDSLSEYPEHSGENAVQQMNTPQVLVERKPHFNQHLCTTAVPKSLQGACS